MFAHRHQVIGVFASLHIGDDDFFLTTNVRSIGNFTVDLSNRASVLRSTSFKELSNPRKTTRNITRLGNLTWSSGELGTTFDFLTFLYGKVSANRNGVASKNVLSLRINNDNLRVQVLFVF